MRGGVFALGNFDGVHRGHRLVIDAAVVAARALKIPARVLTFEPHPRAFFAPDLLPFRLAPPPAKERLLKSCGIDDVVTLNFTDEFAQLSAQDFVEQVLVKQCGAQHVVAGHDFAFGHGRSGNMQLLTKWLAPHGVAVTEIPALGDKAGRAVSSSAIRDHLRQGELVEATDLLGHDWSIAGTVIGGDARGRTLGVPTANVALGDYLRPKFGVYAVRAGRVGELLLYKGVANIGVRPTLNERGVRENLEAHLFDFDEDIYGQEWEFALTRFIRPEQKFGGLDELKAQIARDIITTRESRDEH